MWALVRLYVKLQIKSKKLIQTRKFNFFCLNVFDFKLSKKKNEDFENSNFSFPFFFYYSERLSKKTSTKISSHQSKKKKKNSLEGKFLPEATDVSSCLLIFFFTPAPILLLWVPLKAKRNQFLPLFYVERKELSFIPTINPLMFDFKYLLIMQPLPLILYGILEEGNRISKALSFLSSLVTKISS